MHTKDKWIVTEEERHGYTVWEIHNQEDLYIARAINETNANRIIQMHNSFDDLLEACESARLAINATGKGFLLIKIGAMEKLKQAIAKAEAE